MFPIIISEWKYHDTFIVWSQQDNTDNRDFRDSHSTLLIQIYPEKQNHSANSQYVILWEELRTVIGDLSCDRRYSYLSESMGSANEALRDWKLTVTRAMKRVEQAERMKTRGPKIIL